MLLYNSSNSVNTWHVYAHVRFVPQTGSLGWSLLNLWAISWLRLMEVLREITTKRVDNLQSLQEILCENEPVLILDYMKNWQALSDWNLKYFQSRVSLGTTVKVCIH
jgi:hypothetical protein